MVAEKLSSARVKSPEAADQVFDSFYARGWTDGLPIVPPTEERVLRMLQGTSRRPDQVLGVMPPSMAEVSVEKVAINAVMAGCLSAYLPVVLAAVEAVLNEEFGLYSMQATTHPSTPLLIVNGPVRKTIGLNCGAGLYGPGWRANATIGRAIRLLLINVGGGIPGKMDMATQGQPSKYTYCIGENEETSPWEPLHVELGFPREASTVTVGGAVSPHNVHDSLGDSASHILTIAADEAASLGVNLPTAGILVLCPEHAAHVASEGLSKEDVKRYIYDHARLPLHKVRQSGMYSQAMWPKWWESTNEEALVPAIVDWTNIKVIVAGGPGKHSGWIPGRLAATREVVP